MRWKMTPNLDGPPWPRWWTTMTKRTRWCKVITDWWRALRHSLGPLPNITRDFRWILCSTFLPSVVVGDAEWECHKAGQQYAYTQAWKRNMKGAKRWGKQLRNTAVWLPVSFLHCPSVDLKEPPKQHVPILIDAVVVIKVTWIHLWWDSSVCSLIGVNCTCCSD